MDYYTCTNYADLDVFILTTLKEHKKSKYKLTSL